MGANLINHSDNEENPKEHVNKEEELFFDGERYYTKEEFFNPEEEKPSKSKGKKGLKVTIALVITFALMSNVLSLWPRLFNLDSIQFLAISQELSNNEDVQLYKESIVVVNDASSKGTGFYISDDGYIITNAHVIDNGQPTVTFQNGSTYSTQIVKSDAEIDIAILKIETEPEVHPVLEFEESWRMNEDIFVIGNPLFFNFIANKGQVIGLTENRELPMLMIDAPIYRGNSGSPVINEDGKVIGVVFATTRVDIDGVRNRVGLVVPVQYFNEYIDSL
ncbi:trypsin-like peptidase domain-containing protein [Evansella cellulosilytica]|uniref:Peptidase S7 flavivirus helicase (NS3) n=1 Tax=Evansella cellulosilytica (strain ATCC 21833 / DSM 2522 / FERM P-1141 / JCM 9156 / N-4) TaxID=649639 RepID=E6TQN7_EVAC2|nr:trypsin-like peptidase domain-containing protein [Evansella cellulosilytica]ADU30548.1 Peptidase S7 flavivirus helicase (NS3) [Evansella cellulosilytica DSM 2522]